MCKLTYNHSSKPKASLIVSENSPEIRTCDCRTDTVSLAVKDSPDRCRLSESILRTHPNHKRSSPK